MASKVCKKCKIELPIFFFIINKKESKICSYCIAEGKKYPQLQRYYYVSRLNPEKFKKNHREYKRKYRAKLRLLKTNS